MKRTIMPVIMLAAMMQLNGAAGRASALWSTARTSGLLRPTGQQVFTAGRTTLPQRFVCPAGSRLFSSGSPSTAFRTSGRFGALGKPSAPHAEEGYWSRFKRFLVPTGTAVAAGAYVASQEDEEEPLALRLPRGYAADEDVETARAYYAGREKAISKEESSNIQRLMVAMDRMERAKKLYIEKLKLELEGSSESTVHDALNEWNKANTEVVGLKKALNSKFDTEQAKKDRELNQLLINVEERILLGGGDSLVGLTYAPYGYYAAGDDVRAGKVEQLINAQEKLIKQKRLLKSGMTSQSTVQEVLREWDNAYNAVIADKKEIHSAWEAEKVRMLEENE